MSTPPDFVQSILSSIKQQSSTNTASSVDRYIAQTIQFFKAIDWSQPWLMALVGFHVICFITTIVLRNHHNALSLYFFLLLGLAAMTQTLNHLGQTYWNRFSTVNYFDENGMFIVSVYAFPLIFNGFFTLIFVLKAAANLMVKVKRAQLRSQAQAKNKKKD
ncbi:predicted protein [Lichtheimia corymbifera JMRC:FSU:9682]|uniref:Uncharacterized protein n=1 Tax=Lichtheimia corymbifera JMRC:FSU:9682 TaxID=1263082 RepID=A0A068RKK4_9FUNG|nr:predicted protein [Lichtheimia corymbifera JMRC:FSU:9682]